MKNVTEELTRYLLRHDLIAENQAEWCSYTIHKWICTNVAILLCALIGTFLADMAAALTFTGFLIFLRQRTNGYHAKTEWQCLSVSIAAEAGAMIALPYVTIFPYIIILCIAITGVLLLAPTNNSNIHLSVQEMSAMRWRAYLRTGGSALLSALLWKGGYTRLAGSIALAVFTVAISLALASLGFGINEKGETI